jgi:hypothetical protein
MSRQNGLFSSIFTRRRRSPSIDRKTLHLAEASRSGTVKKIRSSRSYYFPPKRQFSGVLHHTDIPFAEDPGYILPKVHHIGRVMPVEETTYVHVEPDAAKNWRQRILHKVQKTLKMKPHKESRAGFTGKLVPRSFPPEFDEVEIPGQIRHAIPEDEVLLMNRMDQLARKIDPTGEHDMYNYIRWVAYNNSRNLYLMKIRETHPDLWQYYVLKDPITQEDEMAIIDAMVTADRYQDRRSNYLVRDYEIPSGFDIQAIPFKRGGKRIHKTRAKKYNKHGQNKV